MKTKRFISILMTAVMMLSIVFCAVPTVGAVRIPKVTYTATIHASKVDSAYKVYQFNTYKVNCRFKVGNKLICGFTDLISRKNISTESKTVSSKNDTSLIYINGGNNKELVRVYCSVRINSLKVKSFLWKIKKSKRYNSSEKRAIEKYVKSVAGRTISDNIYVIPQPFKAKTVRTSRDLFPGTDVYVKFLTPCEINEEDYAFTTNSPIIEYVKMTRLKNIGKVAQFRVNLPKAKSICKINIVKPGLFQDDVYKTFKVKPYQFVKPGYILE